MPFLRSYSWLKFYIAHLWEKCLKEALLVSCWCCFRKMKVESHLVLKMRKRSVDVSCGLLSLGRTDRVLWILAFACGMDEGLWAKHLGSSLGEAHVSSPPKIVDIFESDSRFSDLNAQLCMALTDIETLQYDRSGSRWFPPGDSPGWSPPWWAPRLRNCDSLSTFITFPIHF